MLLKVLKVPFTADARGQTVQQRGNRLLLVEGGSQTCRLCDELLRCHQALETVADTPAWHHGFGGAGSLFTLTGRLRANATYTARRNRPFQRLAADGAKLALWRFWRAG